MRAIDLLSAPRVTIGDGRRTVSPGRAPGDEGNSSGNSLNNNNNNNKSGVAMLVIIIRLHT